MTEPIIFRSEIIELIRNGGMGSSTSGSETLASLNSQLISLTQRIAKLEGSTTYQENDSPTTNWSYFEELGLVVAAGNTILTKDYSTDDEITLAVLDTQYLPKNTNFIGVANAFKSNASTGAAPLEMAMYFNDTKLVCKPENYISASPTDTYYVQFSTMWFPANDLTSTSSTFTRTNYTLNTSSYYSDADRYYAQIHSKGGVHFFCAYGKTNKESSNLTTLTKDSLLQNTTWGTWHDTTSYFNIGKAYAMSASSGINTAYQGDLSTTCNNSTTISVSFTATVPSGSDVYIYGITFDKTANNVVLGQYSYYTGQGNSGDIEMNTANEYVGNNLFIRYFRYKTLNYIDFHISLMGSIGGSDSWSEVVLHTLNKLPTAATESNIIARYNSNLYPIDIRNQKVLFRLKPSPAPGNNNLYSACVFLYGTSE